MDARVEMMLKLHWFELALRTLRTLDSSAPRHFGTSAEISTVYGPKCPVTWNCCGFVDLSFKQRSSLFMLSSQPYDIRKLRIQPVTY